MIVKKGNNYNMTTNKVKINSARLHTILVFYMTACK